MLKFITAAILIFSVNVHAVENQTEDNSKVQAKAVMDGVYETFRKVIPYVYSDENSVEILKKDAQKKNELIENLNNLSLFFKSAQHVKYFQRPGFRPSLDTMNMHLSDTINAVSTNNFAFAQKRLSALTSLCISCHSQLSTSGAKNAFGENLNKAKREDFESDYAFGNYLFLIRHFSESEKYFVLALDRAIEQSRSHELYSSLRRIISLHTKIEFNYKKADDFVKKYGKVPQMPILAKETLISWDKSLGPWKNFDSNSYGNIDAFIKKYLSPLEEIKEQTGSGDNDITLLIASGVLSKYLNDHPQSKSAPQILYWMSVAEKRLSNTYFFTLSELYLKDCIKKYSSSSYAKKCYNLYEDNILAGYTGSSGLDIPVDEKEELKRLKKYLK